MVYRILTVVVILSLTACGTPPTEHTVGSDQDVIHEQHPMPIQSKKKASEIRSGFSRSVNNVYGIKIPNGMVPAKGPVKVIRFQGKPSIAQVVDLVREQIRFKKETREGEGYLFRFAQARRDRIKRVLAIRIFEQSGETTLDIWKEHVYKEALPDTKASLKRPASFDRKTVSAQSKKVLKQRKERLVDSMRLLQKMQRGEPLTDEEKKSPLFN